jgi:hypothetical protein
LPSARNNVERDEETVPYHAYEHKLALAKGTFEVEYASELMPE